MMMMPTMKTRIVPPPLVLLLLVLLATLCPGTEARTRGASREAYNSPPRDRPSRQAMESIELLKERRQCVPYTEVSAVVLESRETPSAETAEAETKLLESCDPESCVGPTSCCRLLSNTLLCDADNEYPFSACVCNDATRTRTPTQAPVPTPAPSTAPVASATGGGTDDGSEADDGGGNAAGDAPADDGEDQDTVVVGDDNADTSGGDDAGVDQINQGVQTSQEEEDHWYEDPTIVGPIGAGVLVLVAGVLILSSRFKSDSRQSRPVKQLAWEADNGSSDNGSETMRVEKHVELESVQSDYEINELPPEDEEPSEAQEPSSSEGKNKCLEPVATPWFTDWIDRACGPSRARSYDAKDTVVL